ncbi:sigma-70 family RNA polymerase sigma factor [Persicobacter diffluens]|uniref:DNA-directed RNA polymerase sigma-70 factor n=1 Tax=Persicobacter diffluens TaxID=981 RepID=A0AAN4VUZ6_9BACT|nr:DNA-directed RNA polymerase sigma-70 factor [Persicobacter diffluens]
MGKFFQEKCLTSVTAASESASNGQMLNTDTENTILNQIRQGNYSRATLLIDHHKEMVYQICYRILLNQADAEEAAQDSFLKAFEALDQFRGEAKFSTWLYRIAYNMALGKNRQNSRRSVWEWVTDQLPDRQQGPDAAEIMEQEDRKEQVHAAINQLPEEERVIISLYYLEEMSTKEIAEVVNIKPNLVKVRLHRSRKKLEEKLSNRKSMFAL